MTFAPSMLDRLVANAIDPAVAKISGACPGDRRLTRPENARTRHVGPPARAALICRRVEDALAAASVLFEPDAKKLRYRRDLPDPLYELAPVAVDASAPVGLVTVDLLTAGFEAVYVICGGEADDRFAAQLQCQLRWAEQVTLTAVVAPERPGLALSLATTAPAARPMHLERLIRRAAVRELRRAIAVLVDVEPGIARDLLDRHPALLDPRSGT
jgi:hypothetical protein